MCSNHYSLNEKEKLKKRNKRIALAVIFLIIGIISVMYTVSAETSFYVKKSTQYDIKFSCEIGGYVCPSATICNLTIVYPNSTVLISNGGATNMDNGYFNFTLLPNQTSINGEYNSRASCFYGGLNDTALFLYEVNPTGIRPTDQRTESITRSIYFMFGIAIVLFIAFLFTRDKVPVKWTFFIISIVFFLIGVNLLFIGIQDEVVNPRLENFFDGFTAISFYFYWFSAGILIFLWFFTFINTWLYKSNMDKFRKFGGEYG